MINVGMLCKSYPVCFPHELLGYKRDELKGVLLSISIMDELNKMEQEEIRKSSSKGPMRGQSARFAKFKRNK